MKKTTAALTLGITASIAFAGGEEGLPILFVTDLEGDRIYRLTDEDNDDTYNQTDETIVFYNEKEGSIALSRAVELTGSPNDFLFITDTFYDRVITMEDLNDDGDCHDAGEHLVYFDGRVGGNVPGIRTELPLGVTTRDLGVVYLANANESTTENDSIIRCEDLNDDGDANDAGEAVEYYVSSPGAPVGDSVPTAVVVAEDLNPYYLENGSAVAKGIYRLVDVNANGTIDAPGEVQAFFLPPAQPNPMDLTSLEVTVHEKKKEGPIREHGELWFVRDMGNDIIWRLEDEDLNGVISPSEATIYFSGSGSADMRDLAVNDEGLVVSVDSQHPSRVLVMADIDGNDVISGGEVSEAYHEDLAPVDMAEPRGVATDFHGHESVGTTFCTSASVSCPCGNQGSFLEGCLNSQFAGAILEGEGTSSASLDDLAFHCTNLPPFAGSMLLVGTLDTTPGVGFFDGISCFGGSTIRLDARVADGNGEIEFGPGLGITGGNQGVPGGWIAGDTRYFQVWYRDANAGSPCGNFANISGGVAVTFTQ